LSRDAATTCISIIRGDRFSTALPEKAGTRKNGKPARLLKPGDVVNIPAGVNHWHSAAKDSWFAHIVLSVPVEGDTTEWRGPVTDEEYGKLG
jgi:hypothetical protein